MGGWADRKDWLLFSRLLEQEALTAQVPNCQDAGALGTARSRTTPAAAHPAAAARVHRSRNPTS